MKAQKARKTVHSLKEQKFTVNICKECGILFHKKKNYDDHLKVYHDDQECQHYSCSECGSLFSRVSQLRQHMVHHDLASLVMAIHKNEQNAQIQQQQTKTPQPQSVKKRAATSSATSLSGLSTASTKTSSVDSPLTISIPPSPASSWQPSSGGTPMPSPAPTKKKLKRSPSIQMPLSRSNSGDSTEPGTPAVLSSECVVCKQRFENAWSMIVHAVQSHGAIIQKVEKKAFGAGDLLLLDTHLEIEQKCGSCGLTFPLPTAYLLHRLQSHRQELFVEPSHATMFMITVEIFFTAPTSDKDKPFRITVKIKKKQPINTGH